MSAPRTSPSPMIARDLEHEQLRVGARRSSSLMTTPVSTGTRMPATCESDREQRRDGERRAVRAQEAEQAHERAPASCRACFVAPRRARLRRVRIVLEAVPNVSEGRRAEVVSAIGEAFAPGRGAARRPLGRRPQPLGLHARGRARASWSSRCSRGSRPPSSASISASTSASIRGSERSTSSPLVPLAPEDDGAREVRGRALVAARVGEELGLPVFLYGEVGDGRRPAFFRRGGLDELRRRVDVGRARPGRRAARSRSAVGRRARRGSARTRRLQPRPRDGRRSGRARRRGVRPRVEWGDARRAGDRAPPARLGSRRRSA